MPEIVFFDGANANPLKTLEAFGRTKLSPDFSLGNINKIETVNMLKHSFLHIPGYKSVLKEKQLWEDGILTWEDLLALKRKDSVKTSFSSKRKKASAKQQTEMPQWYEESHQALSRGDVEYFAKRFPVAEHWRLAVSHPGDAMFLDIETTGLSCGFDKITLIGWSLNGRYNVIINGRDDPTDFLAALSKAKALVTFNGKCFDMKFIEREFGQGVGPTAHTDLRYICRRVGLTGGQKYIERCIGLVRNTTVSDGEEAVFLWTQYRYGRKTKVRQDALRNLIIYNHADVEGMKHIFDACLVKLSQANLLPPGQQQERIFNAFMTNYDFSDENNFPFSLALMDSSIL
jgi:uncharacterized protein YprB with RNaseH-like and TPR domain